MVGLRKTFCAFTAAILFLSFGLHGVWALDTAKSNASGRWSTLKEGNLWWLRTPDGRAFYSRGVNTVNGGTEKDKTRQGEAFHWQNHFTDVGRWRQEAGSNLLRWGFNTLGGWSDPSPELGLPLMVELDLGRNAKLHWFDLFDPANESKTIERAKELTAKYRAHPNLVGYFTDNEVGWWNTPLFRWYLEQGWDNHTKRMVWQLLYDHYEGDWHRFLQDWVPQDGSQSFEDLKKSRIAIKLRAGGEGIRLIDRFTYLCARRYYELVNKALRRAHPGALILGDRLPLYYNQDAVLAMVDQVDVISTNYNVDEPDGWVAPFYFNGLRQLADKPVLVTEFFFAAEENRSGNQNTGHLMTVATQNERAAGLANAIRAFAGFPNVVGAHWFQYYDEPTGGRDDGEDFNMGLVDIANRPYEEVTKAFAGVNGQLENIHRNADLFQIAAVADLKQPYVELPKKTTAISLTDNSLLDWDKAVTRLDGFAAPKPYVPFADVHLLWAPEGLYLASIASNYVDLGLLHYTGSFPLSETFQLHIAVENGEGELHHYAIHLFPEPSKKYPERLEIQPQIYRYNGNRPVDRMPVQGHLQKLNKPLPHISFEAFFPAQWLGFDHLQSGDRLKMKIYITNYYRELTMVWAATGDLKRDRLPVGLNTVLLKDHDQITLLQ